MNNLTLWYSTCPGPSAVALAGHLGLFADEFDSDGVTVRTVTSAPTARSTVHEAHQLVPRPEHFPLLLRHGGNPPPLVALSRQVDLRILGLTWTEATRRVLALDERTIRTPADLAGRRLAVPRRDAVAVDYVRSVTLRTYAEALASAGLTFAGVELVELDAGAWGSDRADALPNDKRLFARGFGSAWSNASTHTAEAIALIRGEVDVFAAEHAQAVSIQAALDLHTVFDTALSEVPARRASGDQPLVLTATGGLVDGWPDLVARFLARTLEAAEWAAGACELARRQIAADVGLPEELLDAAYSTEVHEQLAIDLDDRSIEALEVQHDHLLSQGFLAGAVDISRFIDPGPLEAARVLHAVPAAS